MPSIKELAALPAPDVVEELSFDDIFSAVLSEFKARFPDFSAFLESDPTIKVLEVAAYREMLLRNRINVAARAQMLAFSSGGDLDHLGAFYGVARLLGEGDESLRRRIRQRIMGFSNAGGADLYRYWALTASPEIADVAVDSPQSGHVRISVLSRLNDGAAAPALIDAVKAVVLRDDIRVLTDTVHVLPAEIVPVAVVARVWLLPDTVQQILDAMPGYVAAEFSSSAGLGWDCTRSWLISRLHAAGVHRVELLEPATDMAIQPWQAVRLTGCTIEYAGRDS